MLLNMNWVLFSPTPGTPSGLLQSLFLSPLVPSLHHCPVVLTVQFNVAAESMESGATPSGIKSRLWPPCTVTVHSS